MRPRSWQLRSTRTPGKMEKNPVPKWPKIRIKAQRAAPGQEQHPCRALGPAEHRGCPCSLLHECPCLMSQCLMLQKPLPCAQSPPTKKWDFSKGDAGGISQSKSWLGIGLSVVARKCCYSFPSQSWEMINTGGCLHSAVIHQGGGAWPQRGGEGRSVIV